MAQSGCAVTLHQRRRGKVATSAKKNGVLSPCLSHSLLLNLTECCVGSRKGHFLNPHPRFPGHTASFSAVADSVPIVFTD